MIIFGDIGKCDHNCTPHFSVTEKCNHTWKRRRSEQVTFYAFDDHRGFITLCT